MASSTNLSVQQSTVARKPAKLEFGKFQTENTEQTTTIPTQAQSFIEESLEQDANLEVNNSKRKCNALKLDSSKQPERSFTKCPRHQT